jgi:hypothetical protein
MVARRTLGLGLFAATAGISGGVAALRGNPGLLGSFGPAATLAGFIGGEKEAFIDNPEVIAALRGAGFVLEARRAGSVEMVRDPALLRQQPAFLWPSSAVVAEIARRSGLGILREEIILNAPLVLFSWDRVAEGLASGGLAARLGPRHYELSLDRFLRAVLEGREWSALGVAGQFGRARLLSTDPNRSNSGFMFAGLAANVLAGEVASAATLDRTLRDLLRLFGGMGFKPPSSGRLFEDYLAGGPGVQPMVLGYENQLVEWVLADPARWQRVEATAPARPVMLYPRPTVFSAHPLLALTRPAVPLVDAMLRPAVQQLAWSRHGFRGPLGAGGPSLPAIVAEFIRPSVDDVLPMPDAATMLRLIGALETG